MLIVATTGMGADEYGTSIESIRINGREIPLPAALAFIDEKIRSGTEVECIGLRELCALRLRARRRGLNHGPKEFGKDWPEWAKRCEMQAILFEMARHLGSRLSYLAFVMENNKTPPKEAALIPLQAWTLMYEWLFEAGQNADVSLPKWVWAYFGKASYQMQGLRADMVLSPSNKLKKIPAALGYSGDGRNPFIADHRDLANSTAMLVYDIEGQLGRSGSARIEPVLKIFRTDDERTVRKRIARARKNQRPTFFTE